MQRFGIEGCEALLPGLFPTYTLYPNLEIFEWRGSRTQRFGIEGCEALLPGLEALLERAAARGVSRLEVGMPHRGRLNVRN